MLIDDDDDDDDDDPTSFFLPSPPPSHLWRRKVLLFSFLFLFFLFFFVFLLFTSCMPHRFGTRLHLAPLLLLLLAGLLFPQGLQRSKPLTVWRSARPRWVPRSSPAPAAAARPPHLLHRWVIQTSVTVVLHFN